MVKYKLFLREDNTIKYYYYSEGFINSKPGIIEINLEKETFKILKVAQFDKLSTFSVLEAKYIRDGLNEIRRENGEPELTDEELELPKEDRNYYKYASFVINDLIDKIFENNEIPEAGTIIWY